MLFSAGSFSFENGCLSCFLYLVFQQFFDGVLGTLSIDDEMGRRR